MQYEYVQKKIMKSKAIQGFMTEVCEKAAQILKEELKKDELKNRSGKKSMNKT